VALPPAIDGGAFGAPTTDHPLFSLAFSPSRRARPPQQTFIKISLLFQDLPFLDVYYSPDAH